MLAWHELDTVLLDMDGTILDLAFDNYFWRELVPRCMARARAQSFAAAHGELTELYAAKAGSLDWYCLDYWTEALDLDLRALKAASSHRIRFLPGARDFLQQLAASGRRVVLVTNAHGATLDIKRAVAGLDRYFDGFVSSHQFGHAKEQAAFWPALQAHLDFDPQTTVFVDDSEPVLSAARSFGLAAVVAVRRPDTTVPGRPPDQVPSVAALDELAPAKPR